MIEIIARFTWRFRQCKNNQKSSGPGFWKFNNSLLDNEEFVTHLKIFFIYSCFEKGCPTKPYATMPKGIMGNEGSWSLIEVLSILAT